MIHRLFDIDSDPMAVTRATNAPCDGTAVSVSVPEPPTPEADMGSAGPRDALRTFLPPEVAMPRWERGAYRIALVGPSGTGKTVTLAKLGTHGSVLGGFRVGFVTVHPDQAVAVRRLRAVTGMASARIEAVSRSEEVAPALARLEDSDVVLIDTPGVWWAPGAGGDSLRAILAALAPQEIHLVLPAGMNAGLAESHVTEALSGGVTHILPSKVDESPNDWSLFELAAVNDVPMRWVADGEDVPAALRWAGPRLGAVSATGRIEPMPEVGVEDSHLRPDRAALLRGIRSVSRPEVTSPTGARPVLVVGSGKGGVGKSLLSAMLAATMAETGRRVLLVDGDQTLGNQHVLLGVPPADRLEDLVRGRVEPRELLQPVADNLMLLPSDSGHDMTYRLEAIDRARLHYSLSTLFEDFDAVVVDAGSGIDGVVRAAAMQATRLVVVTAPEPAALADGYALINIVNRELGTLPIDLLVNRAEDDDEGRLTYEKLSAAIERDLRRGVRHLGTITEHGALRAAARDPRLVLEAPFHDVIGPRLRTVVQRLDLPAIIQPVRTAPQFGRE